MSLRFIHSADWHLFSPFSGIGSDFPELLPELLEAPKKALKNLVNVALQNNVDFLLVAGDVFDDVPNYLQMSETLEILSPLGQSGIPVYVVTGNHDLGAWQNFTLPEWLQVFSAEKPEVKIFCKNGIPSAAICGISYSEANHHENLAVKLADLPVADNLFKIGLLHSNAGNQTDFELPYAPCDAATFRNSGMDYWALGHIHIPGAVEHTANVFYSGALQGRSVKEEGRHGCALVMTDGHNFSREQVYCDALCFRQLEYEIPADCMTMDSLFNVLTEYLSSSDALLSGQRCLVRLKLTGATVLNHELRHDYDTKSLRLPVQKKLEKNGLSRVIIESVQAATGEPLDSELRSGLASEVAVELENLRDSAEFKQLFNLFAKRSDLKNHFSKEDFSGDELRRIADEAAELLINELAAEGR